MRIVSTFLALASRVSAEGLIFKVLIVILSREKIIPTSRRSRLRVGLGVVKERLIFEISGMRDAGRKMRDLRKSARGLAQSKTLCAVRKLFRNIG